MRESASASPTITTIARSSDEHVAEMAGMRKAIELAIEEEHRRHIAAIVDLHTRWNDLASVNRLSPELLAEIFCHLALDAYVKRVKTRRFAKPGRPYYRFMRVSHVCGRWRTVALDSPRLWNNIVGSPAHKHFGEFLSRSRQAPLYLAVHCAPSPPADIVDALAPEFARVHDLRLSGPLQSIVETWTGLSGLGHSLQILKLLADDSSPLPTQDRPPLLSLELDMPFLRQLVLNFVPCSWSGALCCPSVTTLCITAIRGSGSKPRGELGRLIAALASMPALKVLRLTHAIPASGDVLPSPTIPVCTLPCLREVSLVDESADCAGLLEHLSFVADATFIMKLEGHGTSGTGALARAFAAHLANRPGMRRMRIEAAPSTLHILMWRSIVEPPATCRSCRKSTSKATLAFLGVDNKVATRAVREALKRGAVLSRIRRLCLSSPHSASGARWAAEFLQIFKPVDPEQVPPRVPFPRVGALHLNNVRFKAARDATPTLLEPLKEWLAQRRELDVPVTQLQITDCMGLEVPGVVELREVAEDVVWDGHEHAWPADMPVDLVSSDED